MPCFFLRTDSLFFPSKKPNTVATLLHPPTQSILAVHSPRLYTNTPTAAPPPSSLPGFSFGFAPIGTPPPWLPSVLGNGRTAVVPPRTGEAIAPGMPFSTRHVVPVVQRRSGLCCPRPVPHLHSNFHRGSPPRCCVFRARQLCTCGPLLIPLHSTLWPFGGATLWHCGRRSGAPPDAAAAQVSL